MENKVFILEAGEVIRRTVHNAKAEPSGLYFQRAILRTFIGIAYRRVVDSGVFPHIQIDVVSVRTKVKHFLSGRNNAFLRGHKHIVGKRRRVNLRAGILLRLWFSPLNRNGVERQQIVGLRLLRYNREIIADRRRLTPIQSLIKEIAHRNLHDMPVAVTPELVLALQMDHSRSPVRPFQFDKQRHQRSGGNRKSKIVGLTVERRKVKRLRTAESETEPSRIGNVQA